MKKRTSVWKYAFSTPIWLDPAALFDGRYVRIKKPVSAPKTQICIITGINRKEGTVTISRKPRKLK